MGESAEVERIVVDPEVMLGKPIFRGTRIPVYIVLDLLAAGAPPTEIVDDYPDLTLGDVDAALIYRDRLDENGFLRIL